MQLHSKVMPSLPNPLLLSDFLSSCLDQGGLIGMLALNGIFTLVTRHGLEYPHFYARLYALLQVRQPSPLHNLWHVTPNAVHLYLYIFCVVHQFVSNNHSNSGSNKHSFRGTVVFQHSSIIGNMHSAWASSGYTSHQ